MANPERERLLRTLKQELQFLESGGYRAKNNWRPPFIFEDSPSCMREPSSECSASGCALLQFVPEARTKGTSPCRHIPLTLQGQTVDSFYKTGTQEELEKALRSWLTARIKELEG
jgi:hypothetical protein